MSDPAFFTSRQIEKKTFDEKNNAMRVIQVGASYAIDIRASDGDSVLMVGQSDTGAQTVAKIDSEGNQSVISPSIAKKVSITTESGIIILPFSIVGMNSVCMTTTINCPGCVLEISPSDSDDFFVQTNNGSVCARRARVRMDAASPTPFDLYVVAQG